MRTFEYVEGTSSKFWNIERKGNSFLVTYGRIGTPGQTQVKDFPDADRAQKEYDKAVNEKLKKGYRETSPSARTPGSLRESLEQALAEDPEELANHMAYADYLSEQGDPLGEFIRIQLALEDTRTPAAERKKLQQQEKQLLDSHAKEWLGDLAPFVFPDPEKEAEEDEWDVLKVEYTFRRGWLDSLKVHRPTVLFTRALAKAPQARLVRHLEIPGTRYEDDTEPEPGENFPDGCDNPCLFVLSRATTLGNVRTFILGERMSDEEDDGYLEYGPRCHTNGEGAVAAVKAMPRLEELYLLTHRPDTKQLFALKSLHNLRVLQVDHCHDYPLAALAKNPSLGNLTHLRCWPHALEDGDNPYIRTADVRAVVTSPTLNSLTHIRFRCSDTGDAGVQEIINSGILIRLKVLDLRHGRVTDVGARALAACRDATNLELLDLCNNALTSAGIKALQDADIKVKALGQWEMPANLERDDEQYLYCGDVE